MSKSQVDLWWSAREADRQVSRVYFRKRQTTSANANHEHFERGIKRSVCIITKLTRCQSPSNAWLLISSMLLDLLYAENLWKHIHCAADCSTFKFVRNKYDDLIITAKNTTITLSVYLLTTPNGSSKLSTNYCTANLLHPVPYISLAAWQLRLFLHWQNI